MLVHPRFSIDLSDWLLEAALGEYSDRLTRLAVLRWLTVVPMLLHILRAAEHHLFIASSDRVEKASPWDVTGLDDANAQMRLHVQVQALAVRRITASSDKLLKALPAPSSCIVRHITGQQYWSVRRSPSIVYP
jgi:hypothetical protein